MFAYNKKQILYLHTEYRKKLTKIKIQDSDNQYINIVIIINFK